MSCKFALSFSFSPHTRSVAAFLNLCVGFTLLLAVSLSLAFGSWWIWRKPAVTRNAPNSLQDSHRHLSPQTQNSTLMHIHTFLYQAYARLYAPWR
jgi:hypothetical protein